MDALAASRIRQALDSNDLVEAARLLRQQPSIARDYDAVILGGELLFRSKKYVDAGKFFAIGQELHPSGYLASYWIGVTHEALNEKDAAVAAYASALQKNPNHQASFNALTKLSPGLSGDEQSRAAEKAPMYSQFQMPTSDEEREKFLAARLAIQKEVFWQDNWFILPRPLRWAIITFLILVILGFIVGIIGLLWNSFSNPSEVEYCRHILDKMPQNYPPNCEKYR